MTYKSLETIIREKQREDLMKRMQEAAVKRGKVTSDVLKEEPKPEELKEEAPVEGEPLVEAEQVDEHLDKGASASDYIHDFVHSKNKKFDGDSKKQRIKRALGAYYKKNESEVEEAMGGEMSPLQQKMKAQRDQLQKQKDQIRLQIAQQKAAKQEQIMKQKAEQQLQKVKEEKPLEEWGNAGPYRVRSFRAARRLQTLHQNRYNQLNARGDRTRAEIHRKRAMELKRIMYNAKDNPERAPIQ